MRRLKNYQVGFTTIELSIAIALIVVVVAAGGLVYKHHTDTAKKISDTTSSQNVTQKANQGTTTTPSQSTSYLDISQWDVKLPLSSGISDAYYTPSTGGSVGSDGKPNTMLVGLKSLDNDGCSATNTSAIGIIFRALPSETDSATGKLYTQEYPNGVTIGGYLYAYQALNSEMCKAPTATVQSVNSAFTTATQNAGTYTPSSNE